MAGIGILTRTHNLLQQIFNWSWLVHPWHRARSSCQDPQGSGLLGQAHCGASQKHASRRQWDQGKNRYNTLVCSARFEPHSLSLSLSLSLFSRDVVTLSLRTEVLPPRPPVIPPSPPPSLVRMDSPSISHSRQRHRHLPPCMKQLDQ